MSFLSIEKLAKSYKEENVLKNIDFCMRQSEMAVIVGASGCGKTTFLRILAGLEEADCGKIILDNKNIVNLSPEKRNIGMVFQKYSLFSNMTVRENIAYGLKVKKVCKENIKKKTDELLVKIHMLDKGETYPKYLSGGEQQRVAFARALAVEPKLVLFDEPFSALDKKLRKELCSELKKLQKENGLTAIFVTHDIEEAIVMADSIHIMHNGIIEQSGKPKDIYFHPQNTYIANFMGECNIFDAKVFCKVTNYNSPFKYIVVRNENVILSKKNIVEKEKISIPVIISDIIFGGKIVKYKLKNELLEFDAERVFVEVNDLKIGSKIFAIINEKDIIGLNE